MTELDMVIRAAERTKERLITFADGTADGPKIQPDDYRSVVQDIGAFGTFVQELQRLREREMP